MSKLARYSSRNVPLARPRACAKCGSPFHSLCPRDRAPLERGGRVNPRREDPRRGREIDEAYLDTCRSSKTPGVACLIFRRFGPEVGLCWGPIEPDHQRDMTGMGIRFDDRGAYPACRFHHDRIERFDIPGATTREGRKVLRASLIAEHHADLERGHPLPPLPF